MIKQAKNTVAGGLEERIELCRVQLQSIKWLTKAFGRAWLLPVGRTKEKRPQVMTAEGDYWSVLPNDNYNAFSFFIGRGAGTPVDSDEPFTQTSSWWVKSVDLIFYMNLEKISPLDNYYYIERLHAEIMPILANCSGVVVQEYWLEDIAEVYDGMDINEIKSALLYYPYGGIRYNLSINYRENC